MFFPLINGALSKWESSLILIKCTKTIVDYEESESTEGIPFMGVIMPLSPEQLTIKPLELRSWKWMQLYVRRPFNILETNDKIEDENGVLYKVMAIIDYTRSGFHEYHLVAEYHD